MLLRNLSKLFPDLNRYDVVVVHDLHEYTVDELREKPALLDRPIKEILVGCHGIMRQIELEVRI